MAEINEILQDSAICPAAEAEQRDLSAPGVKKGFGGFLKSILRALCARKKQVSAQRSHKSAQDWRDELQAKNPWWGNGL